MPMCIYRSLWFCRGERRKAVRLGRQDENKIIVTIKQASRDPKTENVKYTTLESFDVYEAKPDEVRKVVVDALSAASKK
jgi:hypothetical protein